MLPQTIPHPIRGETAKRMGHPDLGLGDGLEVLAAQAGALAAAAGGEDVAALVAGFGGFHRVAPLPRGSIAKIFKGKEIEAGLYPSVLISGLMAKARRLAGLVFYL